MSQALAAAEACIAILKPLEAYKTTYPNKVFDYMAAGRPIVLAIDGVIRAVVDARSAACSPRRGSVCDGRRDLSVGKRSAEQPPDGITRAKVFGGKFQP